MVACIVSKEVLASLGITKLPYFPAFDRVLVFQLQDAIGEKAGKDSVIFVPEAIQHREKRGECRGVLIAAGATALDHLVAHGIEVGDVVWFSKLAVWRHVIERRDGKEIEVMFLRSADIAGSEKLLDMVQDDEAEIVADSAGNHQWKISGELRPRFQPPVDDQ